MHHSQIFTHTASSAPMQISAQNLLPFLDISPDALLVVNQAGVMVMVNEQAAALFGSSREKLLGQPLERLLPERLQVPDWMHQEHFFSAPRNHPMGVELSPFGLRQDGEEFPVDISLRPLVIDGLLHVIAAIRDVTEQRVAERERIQQLEHIHLHTKLINMAHDAILIRDPINRILSWNRGAEELYGWSAREALGRVSHTLLKTHFPRSRSALDAALEHTGQWEGELTHACRDGRSVLVESRQMLVRDETGQPQEILEINRDISKRHRQEQTEHAIQKETAMHLTFLRQVIDALPTSTSLVYGPDARLLLANQAASRLWGSHWQENQPMGAFLERNGIEITDAQGRPLPQDQFATLRTLQRGENVIGQQEIIKRSDGSNIPVLVSAVAFSEEQSVRLPQKKTGPLTLGTEPLALVIHQDVTLLKEADYLKDEFIGIAAHELRTPLAVLTGYADMLLVQTARGHGPALAAWQQEALEEIKLATTRLVTLTEDLLDVTRLQAGRLILQRSWTNVIPLIQRVAKELQQTTARHRIEVHTPPSHLVVSLEIDAKRIEQVMTNLISNAIKYSPQGGLISVTLREDPPTQSAQIEVQDTGIGIPQSQQARLFGRFIRADNAIAWGISGTGLGLYLCRELVEQHGGHLWFASEEGRGSTFFLTLPGKLEVLVPLSVPYDA